MTAASAWHAPPPPVPWIGERRQITVLFCDLVGSTSLVSALDPEDARDILRTYQSVCAQVIAAHGGYVAQYLGDGILVYFGYPAASEHAAERAVQAGLEMTSAVAAIRARSSALAVRIGLATGLTVVGDGPGAQVTVTGHAVNLASRIQMLMAAGCVGMADTTHDLVRGQIECSDAGLHDLRGIDGSTRIWIARRRKVVGHRHRRSGTPLLDRETEMTQLRTLWRTATGGSPRTVTLWGEAGIGKSRLADELRREVRGTGNAIKLICSALHTLSPLYPVTSFLDRASLRRGHDAACRVRLVARLLGDDAAALTLASLLFPRDAGCEDQGDMPASARKALVLDLLVGRIAALTRDAPLLLIVEDMQWADPTTVELVDRLVAATDAGRLLLVLTVRCEAEPALAGRGGTAAIALRGLDEMVRRRLIAATAASLPAETIARIGARSDGNPLHAIEMALAATETAPGNLAGTVPLTLFDSFAARLDRLGDARDIAQIAAVIGRRFAAKTLAAVSGSSDASVRAALARLVAAGVIEAIGGGQYAAYQFHHALLQEVAYATLLRSRRRTIHARVAVILDADDGGEPETIGFHWSAAGRPERAVPCWLAAGHAALACGSTAEATGHFLQALQDCEATPADTALPPAAAFQGLLGLGQASYVANGPAHVDTVAAFSRAQALVETVADIEQRAMLLYGIFSGYHFASRLDLADEPARRMLWLARRSGDPFHLCQAHRMLGYIAFFRGEASVARTHFDRVAMHYDRTKHPALAGRFGADSLAATESFASVLDALSDTGEGATRRARGALDHARHTGHNPSIGWAWSASAYVGFLRGDRSSTARIAAMGVAFCAEHRIVSWHAHCRLFETWASPAPDADEVRAIMALAAGGNRLGLPLFRAVLADVLRGAGDLGAARGELEGALADIAENGQQVFEPFIRQSLGETLIAFGDHAREAAIASLTAAAESAQRTGCTLVSRRSARALLALLPHLGSEEGGIARYWSHLPGALQRDAPGTP
ncbi:MAG: adenylate/guanylate cyclase domain-containing protein [Sphingomonas sp.]